MAANKNSNAATATSAKKDAEDIHVATSYDFSPDDTVTLVVGSEQKRMLVHSTYLTCDSDFFKAALKKEWVEGQSHVIKLPEEDPETMAHYMTFVYSDKLPFDGIEPKKRAHFEARWPVLINLYVCGEHFLNLVCQDAVIKEIIRLTRIKGETGSWWFPTGRVVDTIYCETPEGSRIRRLVVDMHVIRETKAWLSSNVNNPQFLLDLSEAFYDKIREHDAFVAFRNKELDVGNYLGETAMPVCVKCGEDLY